LVISPPKEGLYSSTQAASTHEATPVTTNRASSLLSALPVRVSLVLENGLHRHSIPTGIERGIDMLWREVDDVSIGTRRGHWTAQSFIDTHRPLCA